MKKNNQNSPSLSAAISIRNVSKKFLIPHERISTLRAVFVNMFKKKSHDIFDALDDVSFEVKKGEFFGIVGRNGSGKSTLLKILAGVYTADKGSVDVNGAISPFLELGIGFNPELSGRDNIYLNATVLGLTEKEIDEKFEAIVDFSEIGRFIDQKLKNYSTGMQMRLAFSVAIHTNRDILLMDEVLAVGDINFQAKCIQEFHKHRRAGRTILLVTHNLEIIEQYCDRALLLRNGKLVCIGDPQEVAAKYRDQNISDTEENTVVHILKPNDLGKYVKSISFLNSKGEERKTFFTGDDFSIRVFFDDPAHCPVLNFGVSILDAHDRYISGVNTILDNFDTSQARKDGYFTVHYKKIPFREGRYYLHIGIFGETDDIVIEFLHRTPEFGVFSDNSARGMIQIEHLWK